MLAPSDKVIQLRQLLTERFGAGVLHREAVFPTGLPSLDEIGIPQGALTEIVSPMKAGPGAGLLLYGLLHASIQKGERVVLIDGKDSFAPKELPCADLKRLLWTRCYDAWEAIKAADLIIRDGNVPLVTLLLAMNPAGELRRIPATAWHRLQMLAEKSAVTVIAFLPQAQVSCARLRIAVSGHFPLSGLHRCRNELVPALHLQVERRRMNPERRCEDEDLRRAVCA